MFKRVKPGRQEWGIFGLRWALPAALLVFTFVGPGIPQRDVVPILYVIVIAAVTNLLIALFILQEHWYSFITLLAISIDLILAVAAVAIIDLRVAWIGILPVALVGLYYSWVTGLIVGSATAAILLAISCINPAQVSLDNPALVTVLLPLPAAGPLANLLIRDRMLAPRRRRFVSSQSESANHNRTAEYMSVFIDMAEVLSASKLDPTRVLNSAVDFGLEGLERVGVKGPLFGAILLFDEVDNETGTILRMMRASQTLAPIDHDVVVPGTAGVIATAINLSEPIVTNAPDEDPELSLFKSFRTCKTVLCLPLSSGQDAYGILLTGSKQKNAFSDIHIKLMGAIANQAAASLNNAKLYSSLLEQRDRIVEVEKVARAQLAADLHDGPTQTISAITMRLNFIRRIIDKTPDEAMNELYQIEDMARRTAKEIRAMLFELRPKSLEKGLKAGLQQLAIQMRETYDQVIEVNIEDSCDQLLDSHTTQTLFSIVTETLNNARKHAEASLIQIHMGIHQEMLVLGIKDDGKGFDVKQALSEAREREGHLGLINLYERATLIEGTLKIDSEPGSGTLTTVTIPIKVLHARKDEEDARQPKAGGKESHTPA